MLELHTQRSDKNMLPEDVLQGMRNNPTPCLCLRESGPARNETVNNADENMPESKSGVLLLSREVPADAVPCALKAGARARGVALCAEG